MKIENTLSTISLSVRNPVPKQEKKSSSWNLFFFLGSHLGKFQLPPTKSLLKVQIKRLTKLRLHCINLDWRYQWHFFQYFYIPQFHLGIGIDPWDQILVILVQGFHWDQEVFQCGNQQNSCLFFPIPFCHISNRPLMPGWSISCLQ